MKKTKVIRNIEDKMQELDPSTIRYRVLENARDFKTSWISLGQALYTVWKDKLYKEWGYTDFEAYSKKEMGVRKQTALKLLRSYSFLEKEAPGYTDSRFTESTEAGSVPTYEAVDVLRQAKKKDIDKEDYAKIKKYVLEQGKDARDVKKDLTQMVKQREELDPREVRQEKRKKVLRRFVSSLRSISKEIRVSKLLPDSIAREADELIDKIEGEAL